VSGKQSQILKKIAKEESAATKVAPPTPQEDPIEIEPTPEPETTPESAE
jgi:hypothetical protein